MCLSKFKSLWELAKYEIQQFDRRTMMTCFVEVAGLNSYIHRFISGRSTAFQSGQEVLLYGR